MIFENFHIDGLVHLVPKIFNDERGYFIETYNQKALNKLIKKEITFLQDNQSYSKKGVLRGLHYQKHPFAQGKLVRVIEGEIFDVAVDIRTKSNTFGEWVGVKLNSERNNQLWVPEGFAHGFLTLSSFAVVAYKCTRTYVRSHEGTIRWNDPTLNIKWPYINNLIISPKDMEASIFSKENTYF